MYTSKYALLIQYVQYNKNVSSVLLGVVKIHKPSSP